jgi:hypothetical protein
METRSLLGAALTRELWSVAFPDRPFDEDARLADTYYAAKGRNEKGLRSHLTRRLTVNAGSLPDPYRIWFTAPWHKFYTLNLDDLEFAVERRFTLPRPIRSLSATSGRSLGSNAFEALEVVHLNGTVSDSLEDMTFSDTDYASRSISPNALYTQCSVDVVSRHVLFVGTELHESLLWQYLEFRKTRGGRSQRELRPGSYLVCPTLNEARQYFLRELNVDWVPMNSDDFVRDVLLELRPAFAEGDAALRPRGKSETRRPAPDLVTDIPAFTSTSTTSECLMGHEPTWADLHEGRAIERDADSALYSAAKRLSRPPVLNCLSWLVEPPAPARARA